MADENKENEEKVQHSLGEVIQLLNKISSINLKYSTVSRALHSKQTKLAKQQLREQAKAEAVVVCAKYKLGKEEEAQAIEAITAQYEEDFEKMSIEFKEKETALRTQHENNENEYEELIIKEAEARKAYKQEKKSQEYKDFMKLNEKAQKDLELYASRQDVAPEAVQKILDGLKEMASANPLNRYAEEMKKIEERKKEIEAANKEIEGQLEKLEADFEKSWDELDINKNQALVDAKKDLVKPTLRQRMSNFFTSKAKRRELAKEEAKKKREERIEKIKEVAGLVETGIVTGVSNAKESIKAWNERRKERNLERINTIYKKLTESYQSKEEQMDNLREEVDTFVKENTVPVPGAKDPIIETDEVKVEIEEPGAAGRPGNAVAGEGAKVQPEKETKPSKEGADHGDR